MLKQPHYTQTAPLYSNSPHYLKQPHYTQTASLYSNSPTILKTAPLYSNSPTILKQPHYTQTAPLYSVSNTHGSSSYCLHKTTSIYPLIYILHLSRYNILLHSHVREICNFIDEILSCNADRSQGTYSLLHTADSLLISSVIKITSLTS